MKTILWHSSFRAWPVALALALVATDGRAEEPGALAPITPGPSMTLAEALTAADQRNLALAAARAEIDKADAALARAWALNFPQLSGHLNYAHNDHADTFNIGDSLAPVLGGLGLTLPPAPDLVVRPQEDLRGSLQLMVPVVNLQAWLGVGAARAGVRVANLTVENVRSQLLLATAQAFWVSVVQHEMVAIHESQVRFAEEHANVTRGRVNAGDALRIDMVRAETELERARQDLLSAHLGLDNARDTLAMLTATEGLPLPEEPPPLPAPPTAASAIETALRERPDVRAQEAAIDLAERMVDVSWMQFLPTLSVGGQASYLFTDPPDLGSDDRSRWAALIMLSVPLYNQMRYADLDAKRAAANQTALRLRELEANVALEVRRAQRDYSSALATTVTAERQAALAREALALAESAYANGATTSLDVSDAQRAGRAAEINAAAQRLRAQMAQLTLMRALGEDLSLLGRK